MTYTFELIPSNKKEELEYWKTKLKEFEKTIKILKKDFEIPLNFYEKCLYFSRNIRRLEKEVKE